MPHGAYLPHFIAVQSQKRVEDQAGFRAFFPLDQDEKRRFPGVVGGGTQPFRLDPLFPHGAERVSQALRPVDGVKASAVFEPSGSGARHVPEGTGPVRTGEGPPGQRAFASGGEKGRVGDREIEALFRKGKLLPQISRKDLQRERIDPGVFPRGFGGRGIDLHPGGIGDPPGQKKQGDDPAPGPEIQKPVAL